MRWFKEEMDLWQHEGAVLALRNVLPRMLRAKFGRLPRAIQRIIDATDDLSQLNTWVTRLVWAESIHDIGIGTERRA